MEHACHRCGATIEEGIPFCPSCSAPQIRVVREIPDDAASPPLPPGTPGNLQPPAVPVRLGAPRPEWHAARRGAIGWGLVATVITFFLMAAPAGFFLAAIFGFGIAGALAVRGYARSRLGPLTGGIGARIGAVSGLVGLVILELLTVASALFAPQFRNNPEMNAALNQRLQGAEPQVRELMSRLLDHPAELALLLGIAAFFYGLIFVLSAAAGGALEARRHRF